MTQIIENRDKPLLARPLRKPKQTFEAQNSQSNIFASLRSTQPMPSINNKLRGRSYDFVGTHQFKQKYLQNDQPEVIHKSYTRPIKQSNIFEDADKQYNGTMNMSGSQLMNTTINRHTILSKMTKDQSNVVTKQTRQLHRYREYQQYWEDQSKKLHKKSFKKQNHKTLLQNQVKPLYIHPNKDRMAILNEHVVHVWEMSLRNNNKQLHEHIKGNNFGKLQLQKLLQSQDGLKKVERSIPVLPLQKLKGISNKGLSLTGRNKSCSSTQRSNPTTYRSQAQSCNTEQVYKISYEGAHKWLSTQGL